MTEARSATGRLEQLLPTRNAEYRALLRNMDKVLDIDANVFILGESGTGKDFVAEILHRAGKRASFPFIKIDCTNLPGELFESEVFGYERGAFTDAHERKVGKIELAQGGTLFFDELAGLDARLQAKLLRVIQEKQFQRLGGNKSIHLDVRILSSSNLDVEELVARSLFRKDLYYRLNVVSFTLPPLRERKEDIAVLAERFARSAAERYHRPQPRLAPATLECLQRYHWPGNVRELKNVVERAVILAGTPDILPEALPAERFLSPQDYIAAAREGRWPLERLEAEYIREILRLTRGNKSRAAEVLGIARKTLLEKRRRYGLP